MNRVFLDLDGVMADLEGDYLRRFGHTMDAAPSRKQMWANINGIEDYFYHLPPMQGAQDFYAKLKEWNPIILTSCPSSRYHEVARQKIAWVRLHLDPDVLVIPAYGSESKQWFAQKSGDILIDDYGKNCREWTAAGGIAIQHRGSDFKRTWNNFREVIRASARAA